MEQKINVAEILKDCPKGMELDCVMFENVTFEGIKQDGYPIIVKIKEPPMALSLTKYGGWNLYNSAKCVIFPKGKTTWEGFVPPCKFKDGDALFVDCSDDEEDKSYQYIFILNKPEFLGKWHSYCMLDGVGCFHSKETYLTDEEYHPRFATEEEKQKLFCAIKDNGYKWNTNTKTLEKLIKPKFKVGDRIRYAGENFPIKIIGIKNNQYQIECFCDKYSDYKNGIIPVSEENNYMLIPKFDIATLKPFESRVLVRHNKDNKWCGSFFSHIDGDFQSHCYKYVTTAGKSYPMCIPYEGNEHLLNKTGDCDIFYKNW